MQSGFSTLESSINELHEQILESVHNIKKLLSKKIKKNGSFSQIQMLLIVIHKMKCNLCKNNSKIAFSVNTDCCNIRSELNLLK